MNVKLFSRLKIRQKLILVFLPLPLLAVILIGSLWYWNALKAVRTTLEEQTSILAQNATLLIGEFLELRHLEINSIVDQGWLENFFLEASVDAKERYKDRFRRLLINLGSGYFQITCFDIRNLPFAKVQLTSFEYCIAMRGMSRRSAIESTITISLLLSVIIMILLN